MAGETNGDSGEEEVRKLQGSVYALDAGWV